jgi:hypothetical protein
MNRFRAIVILGWGLWVVLVVAAIALQSRDMLIFLIGGAVGAILVSIAIWLGKRG